MADTLNRYQSNLTAEQVDQALHKIGQVDDSIARAQAFAEQAGQYADSINPAGFAPKSHADSSAQYGAATAELFGHVKLSDTAGSGDAADGIAATPLGVQAAIEAAAPDFGWHTASGSLQNCNGTYSFVRACYNTGAQLMYLVIGILGATADRGVVVASVALPSGYSLAMTSGEIGALTKTGDNTVAENQAAGFEIRQSGTTIEVIETSTNPGGWAKAAIMLPLSHN